MQKLCILCERELPTHDTAQGLADRLCSACLQFLSEQLFRELGQQPKIVRVQ